MCHPGRLAPYVMGAKSEGSSEVCAGASGLRSMGASFPPLPGLLGIARVFRTSRALASLMAGPASGTTILARDDVDDLSDLVLGGSRIGAGGLAHDMAVVLRVVVAQAHEMFGLVTGVASIVRGPSEEEDSTSRARPVG